MYRFIIALSLAFLGGCASSSFEEFGKKIDSAIRKDSSVNQNGVGGSFSLTVNVIPSDSTVKIMNIKPRYYDGIKLKSGAYDVLVQREGYKPHREWVSISSSNLSRNVVLSAVAQKNASQSSPTTTQESSRTENKVEELKPVETGEATQQEVSKELVAQSKPKPVTKPAVKKVQKTKVIAKKAPKNQGDRKLRADYIPPELAKESVFEPAKMTEEELPEFNGAYIKTVDEGFFSDSAQLIELLEKPTYQSKIFLLQAGSDTTYTRVLREKKKIFAVDIEGTITVKLENFNGVIVKGGDNEHIDGVSLNKVKRWVRGYDADGGKSGKIAVFMDSNKHVDGGGSAYTGLSDLKVNKAKLADNTYFIDFKSTPDKGLYMVWISKRYWFFNLI